MQVERTDGKGATNVTTSSVRASGSMGKHLEASMLQALQAKSLDAGSRARLVKHLSAGCLRCWRNVECFVPIHPKPTEAEEPDALWLALWRPPSAADLLRPAHRRAVREARSGRLGFAHLVLEEARELALGDPRRGEERIGEAQRLLAAAGLEQIDELSARELEALGWVYLADAQRVVGHHLEAETSFETARRALASGSGRAEIEATLDELRSQLLRAQGQICGALELLARAESLLDAPGLEGRRAEVLGRRGALLLRLGDEPRALETIEKALALLPEGQSLALRLYLLHNCAATEARLGRVETASAHLDEAEPLYEPHGHDFLRVQRFWVRGLVEMKGQRFEAAEELLRTTIHGLLGLGLGRSAVLALFDLARLYAAAGWEPRFRELESLFEQLSERPAFQAVLQAHGSELMALARRKGVAVPYLEELMKKLDGNGDSSAC